MVCMLQELDRLSLMLLVSGVASHTLCCLNASMLLVSKWERKRSHKKSKSTKTLLMDLFPNNTNIEGATIINACYGGTAALLNAFCGLFLTNGTATTPSSSPPILVPTHAAPPDPLVGLAPLPYLWDAMRPCPLTHGPKPHTANVWGFYKPNHTVKYPTVDGALMLQALEDVYTRFPEKVTLRDGATHSGIQFKAKSPNYLVFHAPYNKLMQNLFPHSPQRDIYRRYWQPPCSTHCPAGSQTGFRLAACDR